jgi:hypothetical protein
MRMRTGVAVLALVGLLAACGDDSGTADTTTTTEAPSTTTTSAPTTTAAPTTTTTPPAEPTGDALPDGVSFGYLTKITIGDTTATATFDLAYLLTGDEAAAAAKADGKELDGDFYIQNNNPKLREVPVDPHAEVIDIDYDACCDGQPSTIADFATTIDHPTPVNLTMADGVATKVEELYFP